MTQARFLSESIGLSQADRTSAVEELDVRLVAGLCKKNNDLENTYFVFER